MTEISIIMPVYNGKNWLEASINSVLEQTFEDFELICVNDCSSDNSEEILKTFSNKDKRIKYYTKENEGPGFALNYGIERAQGKYICFLDQDDKYDKTYLDKMYKAILNSNYDVCICNAYFWEENKPLRKIYLKKYNKEISLNTPKKKKKTMGQFIPQWTKIIKKDFLVKNNIKFPDRINKAHDLPFHYILLALCDKIGYVDENLYYHRYHAGQISYNFGSEEYAYFSALNIFDWLKKQNIPQKNIKKFFKYPLAVAYSGNIDELSRKSLEKLIKEEYFGLDRIFTLIYMKQRLKRLNKKRSNKVMGGGKTKK